MSKRVSGPPRRPRNPVAKAVRTPAFRMQVVPDRRKKWPKHKPQDEQDPAPGELDAAEKNIDADTEE